MPAPTTATRLGVAARVSTVVLLAGYTLLVLARPGRAPSLVTDLTYNGAVIAATASVLARAMSGPSRGAWMALAVGLTSWSLGGLAYISFNRVESPPFPSWADVGYLGIYPAAFVACLALLAGGIRTVPVSRWLDGVVAGTFVGALVALALPAILDGIGGSPAQVAVTLAYPLADAMLLGLVVFGGVVAGRRASLPWALLGLGLAVFAVSDTIYLLRIAGGSYRENTILDIGWPLAVALMAFAAWSPATPRASRAGSLTGNAIPVTCALAALALLVVASTTEIGVAAVALAAISGTASVGRLLVTLREVRRLGDSRRLAITDDLTGLENRRGLYARIDATLAQAGERPVALLLLDLDRFKEINDSLGHHVGDDLLRLVAGRLRDSVGPAATIARLGGDEFVVLATIDAEHAVATAERICRVLEAPLELEGVVTYVSASVGVAVAPGAGSTRSDLLRHADIAMYRAKRVRGSVECYHEGDDLPARSELELAGDLRTAIGAGEIIVHYQPKVRMDDGRVVGVEALARWQHPVHGLLGPQHFIELAERRGLMRALTLDVMRQAVTQHKAWAREGLDLPVAVNLSAADMLDVRLPADVGRLLGELQVAPDNLTLEITENTLMSDPTGTLEVLETLQASGVAFSLDDFGTGFSSLARLKRLPVSELKIDRSFVKDMTTGSDDAAIVRSTIDLAHNLGLRTVAEGVEDVEQWEALRCLGCHVAQGFLLSRPLPADELVAWVRARRPLATVR